MRKDVELIGAVENAITEINTEIHRTPSRVSVSAAEHLRNATHKVVAAFQRADLEAAETERRLRVQMLEISEHAGAHLCRAEAAEAQVEAMRKALEPFAATIPDKPTEDARFYGWNPSVITYGDCKQARAALASSTPESAVYPAEDTIRLLARDLDGACNVLRHIANHGEGVQGIEGARAAARAFLGATSGPVTAGCSGHPYKPHARFLWFCDVCGYAEHERLQHPAPAEARSDNG